MTFEQEYELRETIREVIRRCGKKWCLKHRNGKGTIGTHPSKASAERQERAIHAHGG